MFKIRYATKRDHSFWFALDQHLSKAEFKSKVRGKRCYIISDDRKPIGILRYNLFWDNIPFLTLIHIVDSHHRKGYGRQAMQAWEDEMRTIGYKLVMTSTRVDEEAQHFYRALGYQDKGAIFLDHTPLEQPGELFMVKVLCSL